MTHLRTNADMNEVHKLMAELKMMGREGLYVLPSGRKFEGSYLRCTPFAQLSLLRLRDALKANGYRTTAHA